MATYEGSDTIRRTLERVRARWRRVYVAEGTLLYVALVEAALLVLLIAEGWLHFPAAVRWVLLGALCAVALAGLAWLVLRRVVVDRTDEDIALQTERTYPGTDNGLINAVRLMKETLIPSPAMVEAVVKESAHRVDGVEPKRVISARGVAKRALAAALLLAVLVGLALLFPARLANAFARLTRPDKPIPKIGSVIITDVAPGHTTVVSADPLEVRATIERTNRTDIAAVLHYRFEGGKPKTLAMAADERFERFAAVVRDVRVPLTYHLEIGGTETPRFSVTVVEKPAVLSVWRRHVPPPYTGQKPTEVEDGDGTINVLAGTLVTLRATANKPIREARFVRRHGEDEAISNMLIGPDRRTLTVPQTFRVMKDGTYTLFLVDELGNENTGRVARSIQALGDDAPKVSIIKPGKDTAAPPDGTIEIVLRGTDTYGIARAQLVMWREGSDERILLQDWPRLEPEKHKTLSWTWRLDPAKHRIGDALRYQAKMWDNNDVTGPGIGLSLAYQVRIEDPEAARKQAVERYRDWRLMLQDLLEKQKDLRRETETLGAREEATP